MWGGMPQPSPAMPADAQDPMKNAALLERLHRPRTIFSPNHRIKMNIVPIFLNVMLPWAVFTFCCSMTSFSVMFNRPAIARSLLVLVYMCCAALIALAIQRRRKDTDPTWYSFAALMMTLGAISGSVVGWYNYNLLTKPYLETMDLRILGNLDAHKELGQNVMDAGIVHFAHGNRIDGFKSWHFKHDTTYCVAPIVGGKGQNSKPATLSYDFWVVGKDCCALGASDFRCGDWQTATGGAIRTLDAEALEYYRLAVEQAETLYDIVAAHPIFFHWSQDPLEEVYSWNTKSFKVFCFAISCFFVFVLFAMVVAIAKFSLLGRAKSVYKYCETLAWNARNDPSYGGT